MVKEEKNVSTLNVAMIGLDTSHCEGIVKHLNQANNDHRVPGARIVKAFPGGTDACAVSRDRVEGFTATLRDTYNIPMCDTLEDAADGMDAIILTSVDGRQHLEQFRVLAEIGKPVFIDKPFACSWADGKALVDLSREKNAPIMSASSLRFAAGVTEPRGDMSTVDVCETFGPMSIPDDYPPYFWYGIHSVDVLYLNLGRGCQEVRVIHDDKVTLIVGRWADGRIGIVRGLRNAGAKPFGRVLYAEDAVYHDVADMANPPCAQTLLRTVVGFFQTRQSPIDIEETLEEMAFIEAAETSWKQDGTVVSLAAAACKN